MKDPVALADRRCAVLLRLAAERGERGDVGEARELYSYAECEARRSGRPDLITQVSRALVRSGPCGVSYRRSAAG